MTESVAVWLAGAGAPPEESFGSCLEIAQRWISCVPKPLELFAQATPPDAYSVDAEIATIDSTLDALGAPAAHLVGFSGGGGIALAYALRRPDRVLSLALDEHVIGHHLDVDDEEALWREVDEALALDGLGATLKIVELLNEPGAPPLQLPSPMPDWVASRIWGTPLLLRAVRDVAVGRSDLRGAPWSVYTSYGSGTRQALKGWCQAVADCVPNGTSEVYEGADHNRPAHEIDAERFTAALRSLWGVS